MTKDLKIEEFKIEDIQRIIEEQQTIKQQGADAVVSNGRLMSPIFMPNLKGYALKPDNVAEFNEIKIRFLAQDSAPTTTQLPAGQVCLWIDTNDSNKFYLAFNYLGTIKTIP